jgi:hypothetical protein
MTALMAEPWIWIKCPRCGDTFAVTPGSQRRFCHKCHPESVRRMKQDSRWRDMNNPRPPEIRSKLAEPQPGDIVCPDCSANMGHSQGARGLLGMHKKWRHN